MHKRVSRKYVVYVVFPIALAIFLAIGWLAYQSISAVEESDAWENHTYLVIHEFEALLTSVLEAQSGERGFIITGNDGYLLPYRAALDDIARDRATLKVLIKDSEEQQERLAVLDPLVQGKLSELKVTIDARRSEGFPVASRMVSEHLSKNRMDRIRTLILEGQDHERSLLRERTAKKHAEMAKTRQAMQGGGLAGLAILLSAFFLLNREIAHRSRAEEALLLRNAELEETRDREQAQHWIKTGLNELNVKVRGEKSLQEVSAAALSFLSAYLKAGVGALYLFEEKIATLARIATYARTGAPAARETIALGEGVAGEAAREKQPITLTSLPPGYLAIGSALGEAPPATVVAHPLLYDDRLIGVLELGTFNDLTEAEAAFVKEAAVALAIAINVNQNRQQVDELLQKSQSQEEELRVQQEELQQSNEELEERAQLLEQQREQIEAKNREMEEAGREIVSKALEVERISTYKSDFLANMSHELRTPLNSLMILAGHLQENKGGNLTPKQVEYAATIKAAGTDLLNLINDILDLSKIEAGRLEFVYEEVPVEELCAQVEGIFRPVAEQKGLHFSTRVEDEGKETVRLDPQRTLQVLKNLLSNAMKFTEEGSVTLRVYPPPPDENPLPVPALAFAVADTGVGVPAAQRELIFHPFQQGDSSTSRRFGGTGLGLSISRELARGMDGAILVASEEGRGSVFTLYLPLSPSGAAPPLRERERGEAAAAALRGAAPAAEAAPLPDDRDVLSRGERSILIVEDDLNFARLLMESVRERGFAAIVATDGSSGIELAKRFMPSAILLDVMLPGVDGWSVLQRMKDDLQLRHIPVHFVTCTEERQKALAMGAIGLVTKPVTGEELDSVLDAIEEAVSRTVGNVLVVEDDESEAAALVALLEERGIACTNARTGEQAIGLLAAEQFDCIVLDLGLADMSGFDLLEYIRTLEESRRIPVIIHTGRELSGEESRRLQRYAESIIIKGAKSPERLLNEVTLFLHAMESGLPPEQRGVAPTLLDSDAVLAGKKVLLVDDDMRNIFSLSSVLAEKGMVIVEAENGKVALARLEEHPDTAIVLMDMMMPEMDGYEATRLMRGDPRFARLPIIALTAKAMKGDRETCLEAGASDYIAKPVDAERLLSLLRVWLYHQGSEHP